MQALFPLIPIILSQNTEDIVLQVAPLDDILLPAYCYDLPCVFSYLGFGVPEFYLEIGKDFYKFLPDLYGFIS